MIKDKFIKSSKLIATYFLSRACLLYKKKKLTSNSYDAWTILVSVLLSAQSTDIKVDEILPKLINKFPNVYCFANAKQEDIQIYIKVLGLFRNKAKNLINAAQFVINEYNGVLPRTRIELEQLPGIGRKSSAIIVSKAFGEQAIAVDTHVKRVSIRLGLTNQVNPNKIEEDLNIVFNKSKLIEAHNSLIFHGKLICHARNPRCDECFIKEKCREYSYIKK